MRRSLRQIQLKEPKCANCNASGVLDEKRSFTDPLSPFLPPFSFSGHGDDSTQQARSGGAKVIKKEHGEAEADYIRENETEETDGRENEGTNGKTTRKARTVLDALLKLFSTEWKAESDLLQSTLHDKENLMLCSDCYWCLSQLYEWHSTFLRRGLDPRVHSYLYPLLSLCHKSAKPKCSLTSTHDSQRGGQKEGKDHAPHSTTYSKFRKCSKRRGEEIEERKKDESPSQQSSLGEQIQESCRSRGSEELEILGLNLKEEHEEIGMKEYGLDADETDPFDGYAESNLLAPCTRHSKRKQIHPRHKTPLKKTEISSVEDSSEEVGVESETWYEEKVQPKTRRKRKGNCPIPGKERKIPVHSRRVALLRFICPEAGCGFEAQNKEEYMNHMENTHGKRDVELIPVQDESEDSVCLICNSVFTSLGELTTHCSAKHIPSIRVRSHSCAECPKMFLTKHDLRNHEATHGVSSGFTCSQCPFRTRRRQELGRHLKLIHLQEKNFFCQICMKGFALQWQLNDHSRIHKVERNFFCSEAGCGKAFRTPSNLRQHLESHRGSKYICDICGQSYSRKAYLRLHMNGTHLMLPLPPSQKREGRKRNPNAPPKRPPLKSPTKQKVRDGTSPKTLIIKRINIPQQVDSQMSLDLLPSIPGSEIDEVEVGPGEGEGLLIQEESILRHPNDFDDMGKDEDDEETIHVQLDLGEERGEGECEEIIQVDGDGQEMRSMDMEPPNSFSFPGHQIICYPVGNLISTEDGNTFYITSTAPPQSRQEDEGEGDGRTSITIFNPFTEFIPLQPH